MTYQPEIVQVVPYADYTVDVYFSDGKIVNYSKRICFQRNVKPYVC